jgi:hypothetical protein
MSSLRLLPLFVCAVLLAPSACSLDFGPHRTCFREHVEQERAQGTISLSAPALHASGPFALDRAADVQQTFPSPLWGAFDFFHGGPFELKITQSTGCGEVVIADLGLKQLPPPGTYDMQSAGIAIAACPPGQPVAYPPRCYLLTPATPRTSAGAPDCGAGPYDGQGGPGEYEDLPITGTLVVRTNSATDCRLDNTIVEGEQQSQVCATDFDATLTVDRSIGATRFSAAMDIRFQESIESYECGSFND